VVAWFRAHDQRGEDATVADALEESVVVALGGGVAVEREAEGAGAQVETWDQEDRRSGRGG
jgi:hypothetical protein